MFTNLLTSSISILAIFLFGCLGEILTEKSGNLNLGIPGIMCIGTAGGCWFMSIYIKAFYADPSWALLILFSMLGAILFAGIAGLIYSFLTVTLKCNQNITGLAITIFGTGFSEFFMSNTVHYANTKYKPYFYKAHTLFSKSLPFADNLGWFGKVFLSHGVLTYLAIAIAIIMAIFLSKTKTGLHLRSVGENPATADAAGINVTAYKYLATIIGSAIAGVGGLAFTMDYNSSTWDNSSTIIGLGWLSVALVIFALWRPLLAIIGSLIFAALYILSSKISVNFPAEAIDLLPYIVTIIVLIFTSIFGKKSVQPPASLGLPYFREER